MDLMDSIDLDLLAFILFCSINIFATVGCYLKYLLLRKKYGVNKKRIRELEEDVKALYESASNLGEKVQRVQYDHRLLKDQQEKLSLQEPNRQTYQNAIQAIRNGESLNKISETSGLSKGELELLGLLQRINKKTA